MRGMNVHMNWVTRLLKSKFVAPPAIVFSGLGSIFNNVSCINCHRNDGGGFPSTGTATSGLLMRISQAGTDPHGGPLAVDGYGTQVQDQSVLGYSAEASVQISYAETPFSLIRTVNGSSLRKPILHIAESLPAHSRFPICFLHAWHRP